MAGGGVIVGTGVGVTLAEGWPAGLSWGCTGRTDGFSASTGPWTVDGVVCSGSGKLQVFSD